MRFEEFVESISLSEPPSGLSDALQALWHDARDDWQEAHEIVQEIETKHAAWVHAYLHRKEGDLGNAAYWYSRAGKEVAKDSLKAEWERICRALLDK